MGAIPHAYNGLHQVSRDTWIPGFSKIGDVKFFVGREDYKLQPDEIRVDCPDTSNYILYKTVELLKWALEREYDMVLKLDTDTFCNVEELARQDYSGLDYVGAPVGTIGQLYAGTNCYGFMQGSATWLSAKAARVVISEAIPKMMQLLPECKKYDGTISPYPHSEDLWVAQALTPGILSGDIKVLCDGGYSGGPITYHFARSNKADIVSWMTRLHETRNDLKQMRAIHDSR